MVHIHLEEKCWQHVWQMYLPVPSWLFWWSMRLLLYLNDLEQSGEVQLFCIPMCFNLVCLRLIYLSWNLHSQTPQEKPICFQHGVLCVSSNYRFFYGITRSTMWVANISCGRSSVASFFVEWAVWCLVSGVAWMSFSDWFPDACSTHARRLPPIPFSTPAMQAYVITHSGRLWYQHSLWVCGMQHIDPIARLQSQRSDCSSSITTSWSMSVGGRSLHPNCMMRLLRWINSLKYTW